MHTPCWFLCIVDRMKKWRHPLQGVAIVVETKENISNFYKVEPRQNDKLSHGFWMYAGMMNNGAYRIKVLPIEADGKLALHFEHPTVAGTTPGGWMNREEPATPAAEVGQNNQYNHT